MVPVVAPELARFGQIKVCPVCRTQPVTPEERACPKCGLLVHKPRHEDFHPAVKWFAVWDLVRANRWHRWVDENVFWTDLVRDVVNGTRTGSRPNPFGLSTSAPIEVCLPIVTRLALPWREAGAPFTREQFVPPPTA
jgi:hypothetical protein